MIFWGLPFASLQAATLWVCCSRIPIRAYPLRRYAHIGTASRTMVRLAARRIASPIQISLYLKALIAPH